jgi:hypothetical protein
MRLTCIGVAIYIALLISFTHKQSVVPCGNDPDGVPVCDLKPSYQ